MSKRESGESSAHPEVNRPANWLRRLVGRRAMPERQEALSPVLVFSYNDAVHDMTYEVQYERLLGDTYIPLDEITPNYDRPIVVVAQPQMLGAKERNFYVHEVELELSRNGGYDEKTMYYRVRELSDRKGVKRPAAERFDAMFGGDNRQTYNGDFFANAGAELITFGLKEGSHMSPDTLPHGLYSAADHDHIARLQDDFDGLFLQVEQMKTKGLSQKAF